MSVCLRRSQTLTHAEALRFFLDGVTGGVRIRHQALSPGAAVEVEDVAVTP